MELFGKYKLSTVGIIVIVLECLPNIIWAMAPPAHNPLSNNYAPYQWLEVSEHVLGVAIVILLMWQVTRPMTSRVPILIVGGAILIYWLSWGCYYADMISPFLLAGPMTVLPPIAFGMTALWQRNFVGLVTAVLFLVAHLMVTVLNFVV
jgi:hypothetical protein